jgi:HAD superfamily hydrolase (TIGR01509 family)
MNKFKAVGFDHTGVIAGVPSKVFHQKLFDILKVSVEDLNKAYFNHNLAFNTEEITLDELWKEILEELNRPTLFDEIMVLINKPRELNTDVIQIIKNIRKNGFKLGLLSNDAGEVASPIRSEEHLDKLFDVLCICAETGLVKPDKDALTDFMNKLEVSPGELVYVDDSERILGSIQKFGIQTILFDNADVLRKNLEEKGVL